MFTISKNRWFQGPKIEESKALKWMIPKFQYIILKIYNQLLQSKKIENFKIIRSKIQKFFDFNARKQMTQGPNNNDFKTL